MSPTLPPELYPDDERLSIKLRRCINGYLVPLKGTVRTSTVVSWQGFCLQTAHPKSGASALFVRNPVILPNHWEREERQPYHMLVSP